MYSAGALKVAVVVDLPVNGNWTSVRWIFSTSGLVLEKVTSPGPRYLLQVKTTGPARLRGGAPEEVVSLASSEAHTVSGTGVPTLAVFSTVRPCGPCTVGPCSSKLRTGGLLCTAASSKGEIS